MKRWSVDVPHDHRDRCDLRDQANRRVGAVCDKDRDWRVAYYSPTRTLLDATAFGCFNCAMAVVGRAERAGALNPGIVEEG